MPSGKTHASVTALAAVVTPILLNPASPEGLISGCLLGLIITPDLDVENKTRAHGTVAKIGREIGGKNGKIVGEVFSSLWYVFWWPYGKLLPHRAYWSHAPVIGTLGRLLYAPTLFTLIWLALSYLITDISPPPVAVNIWTWIELHLDNGIQWSEIRGMFISIWAWFISLLTGKASLPFISSNQFLRDGLWGLIIVDTLHAVLDLVVSAAKRTLRRKSNKQPV